MKTSTRYVNQAAIVQGGQSPTEDQFRDACPADHQTLYDAMFCRDARVEWETTDPDPSGANIVHVLLRSQAIAMKRQGFSTHYRIIKRVVTVEEEIVEADELVMH